MTPVETARLLLGAFTCLLLVVAGTSKVTGQQAMRDMADHFAIPWPRYRAIGVLELAAVLGIVVGMWVTWLGIVTGAAVVVLLVGAVVVHARARDSLRDMGPALTTLAAATGYLVLQVMVAG